MVTIPDFARRPGVVAALGMFALAAVAALVVALHANIAPTDGNAPPVTKAGWTGLEGRVFADWSKGPVPEVLVIAADGVVTDAHADTNGWFVIPLKSGYYNITWMTDSNDAGGCRTFDLQNAIRVVPGQATNFQKTYTSCIQGN